MSDMRNRFNLFALALTLLPLSAAPLHAQGSDGFPYSIITPDGSERRAAKRARSAAPPPTQARPVEAKPQAARRTVRRGSSTFSTIPTYQSPLTPLGTVRPMPTAPSMAYPSSRSAPVPGVAGPGGVPAIAPGRPAGQSFQDRASNCISSGTAQGVGPGQIGSFTGSCVGR